MSDRRRRSNVPSGRLSRVLQLGYTASQLAAGGAKEIAGRVTGASQSAAHPLLTLQNALTLADRLSRLRGAAMKVGQMLSLEGDNLLPPEFAAALSKLRDHADVMPERQVHNVLRRELGTDWKNHFSEFETIPIASASIGQVHRAVAADGRSLALKIQYPGVADSLESDVDNLASLVRLARLIPGNPELDPIIAELKVQLSEEIDYERELSQLLRYKELLADDAHVYVPSGYADLSTPRLLAMEYIDAVPLLSWAETATQAQRDQKAAQLIALSLRELLTFGLVQTDPNPSNYLVESASERLVLLDFGATRSVNEHFRGTYERIISALISGNGPELHDALCFAGFITADVPEAARQALTRVVLLTHEVFQTEAYDFGASTLTAQFKGADLAAHRSAFKPPPPPLLFFQRKLAGTFLICKNLRAKVHCKALAVQSLRQTAPQ